MCFSEYLLIFYASTYLGKHQIDAERTPEPEKMSILVLSSHLDPIGEQNDVQYLSISCQYFVYLYCTYLRYCVRTYYTVLRADRTTRQQWATLDAMFYLHPCLLIPVAWRLAHRHVLGQYCGNVLVW